MALRNILIVVRDIEKSIKFYKNLFGLSVINATEDYAMLSEGLVLQEKESWQKLLGEEVQTGNACELFFIENDLDAFIRKLESYMNESGQEILVRRNSWGKRVIMLKDLDGHLIEVAER